MIFKTEAQLLASGWRWTSSGDERWLITSNNNDNSIPEEMLQQLSGTIQNGNRDETGRWVITPAMVTTETEIAKRIIESYE